MQDDPRPSSPASAHDDAAHEAHHLQLLDWMVRHPPSPRACARPGDAASPVRMVLDTNVSLDLIVFQDPRWAGLAAQIADGTCDVLMRADCRAEFARVVGYPQFGLGPRQRLDALAAFDALHRIVPLGECRSTAGADLPVCRDPDDQKFLELAHQARADVLLSKDKAVLKLARRTRRADSFRILSPAEWMREPGGVPGN